MPELPEVEIVKQSLEKTVKFKKIKKVLIKNRNLRFKIQNNMENLLKKQKIINVFRKSKYLIIQFLNNHYLVIHFGMSGTLHLIKKNNYKNTNLSFYHNKDLPEKHNHVEIIFSNFKLVYNDPRRFGFFKYFSSSENFMNYISKIGPEPLDRKFCLAYLKKKVIKKNKNIKNFLLDQKYVSGIGNIYANEILFKSNINPLKISKFLKDKELEKIIKFSKIIIKKAIKRGGSTIRNFKNSTGKQGNYQKEFLVYDRENNVCPTDNCNRKIVKIFISNRSTYFCKICQK